MPGGGGTPREGPGPSWSQMSPWQKGRHIVANVTVEPIIILYSILGVLSGLTTENLFVQKACRVSLNHSAGLCADVVQNDTVYPEVGGAIAALVPSLFGDPPVVLLSILSYLAAVSDSEDRTFRIGMVSTAASAAATVTTAVSGVAYTSLGFTGVYVLNIVLCCLGLAYAHYRLTEPEPPVPRPPGVSLLADFFNWHHVKDTVTVSLKKRPGTRRLQLYMVALLYFALLGPVVGESSVIFLYLTQRFKWETLQVSAFFTFTGIIDSVGCFVATTVFAKWLHMSDCLIGIIAIGCNAFTSPVFALASTDWAVYVVYAASILGAGGFITMRGIATKLVDTEELGKVMSSLAVVEAIIPLVFVTLYSKLYSATADSHPGAYLYISCGVYTLGMLLYCAIWWLQWTEARQAKRRKENDDMNGVANAAFEGSFTTDVGSEPFENRVVRL
ncbi:uncharacterized protein LOC117652524 isoform X2 [Thrips palmi]|uniref:Uncharacterized protein LOC117652524 isoform X2 n=1 Tax=Thrips palmi TaxID=161013 RepID=A0A6P9A664_THRPL|nr:uncharacterized protein LOC117652524 isoform X2 [Thrips palmi]